MFRSRFLWEGVEGDAYGLDIRFFTDKKYLTALDMTGAVVEVYVEWDGGSWSDTTDGGNLTFAEAEDEDVLSVVGEIPVATVNAIAATHGAKAQVRLTELGKTAKSQIGRFVVRQAARQIN